MAYICMWVNSQNKWRARGGWRRGSARKISRASCSRQLRRRCSYIPLAAWATKTSKHGGTRTHTARGCPCVVQGPPMVLSCAGAHWHTQQAHKHADDGGKTLREREEKKIRSRGFFLWDEWRVVGYHGCQNKCFLLCKSTGGDGAASVDGEERGGQKSRGDEGAKNTDVGGREGRQSQDELKVNSF